MPAMPGCLAWVARLLAEEDGAARGQYAPDVGHGVFDPFGGYVLKNGPGHNEIEGVVRERKIVPVYLLEREMRVGGPRGVQSAGVDVDGNVVLRKGGKGWTEAAEATPDLQGIVDLEPGENFADCASLVMMTRK